MVLPSSVSPKRRLCIVISAILASLTTAGVIFGFQALRSLLVDAGIYSDRCHSSSVGDDVNGYTRRPSDFYTFDTVCKSQLLRLNALFTIASSATNAAALPIGFLLDIHSVGPKVNSLLGCFLFGLGTLLFGLSSNELDMFIPAFTLIAIGGPFIFISQLNVASAFPAYSGLIMASITGAFDSSSIIYWVFKELHEWIPWLSYQHLFLGYLVIPLALAITIGILMPSTPFEFERETHLSSSSSSLSGESEPLLLVPEEEPDVAVTQQGEMDHATIRHEGELDEEESTPESKLSALRSKSFAQQLVSPSYIFITIFCSLYVLRLNIYISTITEQLQSISTSTSSKTIESMVQFFNVALPIGGVVAIPMVGYILDNHSTTFIFTTLSFVGIVFGSFVLIHHVSLQFVTIILFVLLRPFVYSTVNEFVGRVFSHRNFGKLYGTLTLISGCVNLLQYPLVELVLDHDNKWELVNVPLLIAQVLLVTSVLYFWRAEGVQRKERVHPSSEYESLE